jgi:hypothetical protein
MTSSPTTRWSAEFRRIPLGRRSFAGWSITSIVPASLATHGTVATLEEKVLKRNKRRKWRRMRANRAAI